RLDPVLPGDHGVPVRRRGRARCDPARAAARRRRRRPRGRGALRRRPPPRRMEAVPGRCPGPAGPDRGGLLRRGVQPVLLRRDVLTPAGRLPGRPRRRGNGIMLMTLSTRPVVTMTETDPGARDPLQVPAPQGLRAVGRLATALDRLGLRTPAARARALAVLMVLVSSGMLWAFVRLLAEEDAIRLPPTATALLGVLVYTQSLALCVRRSRPVLCLAVMA